VYITGLENEHHAKLTHMHKKQSRHLHFDSMRVDVDFDVGIVDVLMLMLVLRKINLTSSKQTVTATATAVSLSTRLLCIYMALVFRDASPGPEPRAERTITAEPRPCTQHACSLTQGCQELLCVCICVRPAKLHNASEFEQT
jgi:hypothetical protein